MRLSVAGKVFRVVRRSLANEWGYCEHPDTPGRKIVLHDEMSPRKELEILFHEIIHAGDWRVPESRVEAISKAASRAAWRLGWRKIQEHDEH